MCTLLRLTMVKTYHTPQHPTTPRQQLQLSPTHAAAAVVAVGAGVGVHPPSHGTVLLAKVRISDEHVERPSISWTRPFLI